MCSKIEATFRDLSLPHCSGTFCLQLRFTQIWIDLLTFCYGSILGSAEIFHDSV